MKKISVTYLLFLFIIPLALAQQMRSFQLYTTPYLSNIPYELYSPTYYDLEYAKKSINIIGLRGERQLRNRLSYKLGFYVMSRRVNDDCFWRYVSSTFDPTIKVRDCNFSYKETHTSFMTPLEISYTILDYKRFKNYISGGIIVSNHIINNCIITNKITSLEDIIDDKKVSIAVGYTGEYGLKYFVSKSLFAFTGVQFFSNSLSSKSIYYGVNCGIGVMWDTQRSLKSSL